ncbi:MAG: hypothetical protein UV71_C0008G0019 [Microgenomates group bacterium GW2011_GWC1_43_13]|nr:MAG: hypothetical protein UV71_C0008G0019 [Microgenomates group bacterium GW2011_GWC1_43_13]
MFTILIIFLEFFTLSTLLIKRHNLLINLATSSLIFLGMLGFLSFILREYLGISYGSFPNYFAIFLFIVVLLTLLLMRKGETNFNFKNYFQFEKIERFEMIFLLAILILIIVGFFIPVRGWDAYSLYDSRARFFESGMKQSDLASLSKYDQTNNLYYFSYPPMTSAIHAVLYASGFSSPTFIYPMFYFSVLTMAYVLVKSLRLPKILIFLTIIPLALNKLLITQIYASYTNLPMLAFQIGCFFYAIMYFRENRSVYMLLSALSLGFSNWTRNLEPTYVAFLFFSIFLILKTKSKKVHKIIVTVLFLLLSVAPRIIWNNYISSIAINIGEIFPSIPILLSRLLDSTYLSNLIDVTFFVYEALFPVLIYVVIYFVVSLIYIFVKTKNRENETIALSTMLLIIFLFVIMVAGTLYFSVTFAWWDQIPGSFLRSNLPLIPLTMILFAFILEKLVNGKKINTFGKKEKVLGRKN